MALEVRWTVRAEKGLNRVLDYLEAEWTAKEIRQFSIRLEAFIERISKHPKLYPQSGKHKNVRKGLVDKNNYIVYRIKPRSQIIEIINLRGTRQKPLKE